MATKASARGLDPVKSEQRLAVPQRPAEPGARLGLRCCGSSMAGVLSRPWWPPRALTFRNTPSRSRPLSLLPSFSPTDVTSVIHWPRPHSQGESFTNSEVGERGGDHASSVRTPLRTRGRGAAGRGPRRSRPERAHTRWERLSKSRGSAWLRTRGILC